jgi:hypothetical protein
MGSRASLEMKYLLATQMDTTKMALFEKDDVPLSNPSFVKKMREGNALGLLIGSQPQVLIFGGPDSCAWPTEVCQDSKVWGRIVWSLESAKGQKSLADGRLFRTTDSRVADPASGHGAAGVTSKLKPYLHHGNES